MAAILKDEFKFPQDNISLLLNQDVTQRAVLAHLEILAERTQPDDRAMFFHAGHGATRKTALGGDIGYISSVES